MAVTDHLDEIEFYSELNYQKIAIEGSNTYSIPFNTDTLITIPHNLGYIPTAKVWFEPIININNSGAAVASGQIWPITGFQYGDFINTPYTYNLCTVAYAYLDANNLYIIVNDSSGGTVNIPLYWRIYYDA